MLRSLSVISFIIDVNWCIEYKKYPAQMLKVASDFRWASGAIENPENLIKNQDIWSLVIIFILMSFMFDQVVIL